MGGRLLRWMALGGLLVGCAAALTASTVPLSRPAPDPAGLRNPSVRVLQMNLCDSGIARCYTGRSVAEASALIRAEGPDVVTLNEVCRSDVSALDQTMTSDGRPGVVVSAFQSAWDRPTGAPVRCRNGQLYGIGLVARLPAAGGYRATGGVYPVQDTRVPEERAWLCLSPATTPASTATAIDTTRGAARDAVVVCTTHLTDSSPAVARAQCRYLLGTVIPGVRARAGSVPVVLGGDFNLRSGGAQDVRSCLPAGDQSADDGIVQHVVATPELVVGAHRAIRMRTTDHPGLLVTLSPEGGSVPGLHHATLG
jgi:endonuclease/exonuclease/phosphatase (EEP) superfamily protein YafD